MPGRSSGWPARGSTLLRGTGRLAGPGVVEVDGTQHTADHVVLANGAAAFTPPIPGLGELEGVWTNREATAMKAVPAICSSWVVGRWVWSWPRRYAGWGAR